MAGNVDSAGLGKGGGGGSVSGPGMMPGMPHPNVSAVNPRQPGTVMPGASVGK